MEIAEHIAALESAGNRFAAVVAQADWDAPVPPCPGWDVRQLPRHLGGIHRWAAAYVGQRRTAVIEADLEEIAGGWPDDSALAAWFVDGLANLTKTLAAAPADLECFTFLAAPSPLAMWARRQAHETSIHRVDAESAASTVTGFPARFAADGIDELLTAFITRPGRGPRAEVRRTLAVVPSDAAARWTVTFDADSCRTDRALDAASDVIVRGTASDLYAWSWNRPTLAEVSIEGDESVARRWRDTVHIRWG